MTCGPHLSLGRAALLGLALAAFAWVPVQAATAALNATDGSLGAVDVCRTYPMVCKGFFDNIKCPGYLQSWSACGANNTGSLDAYNPHCSCGPVDVTWHIHSNIIHAVVEAYYPSWVTYTPNTDNTAVNYCETYTAACHTYFVGIGGCTGNFTVSSCNGNGTLNDYNGQCKCDAYDATDYVRYGAAYAIEQPRVEKYLTQVRANTNTCRKYNNVCLEYFNTTTCPPQYSYRTNSTCGIGINNTNEQYYYQELCACGRYDFSDVDADLVIDSYVQPSYSKVAVYYPFYVTVNSYNISVTPTNLNNSYYIYNNSTQVNVYQVNSTTINITIVNNTYTDYTYYNIYDLKVDYCSTYYSSCKYALDSIACPSNLRTIRSCQYNNNITSYYGLCSCGNYNITDRIGYLILDYVTVNHYPEYIQYYTTTTTTTTTTSNGNTTTTTTTATTVGVPPTTDYYAGFGAADVPLPNATTTLAPVTVVSTTKATAVLTTTAKLTTSTIKTATTVPTTAATTKATVTVAASTTVTTIVTTTATTTMTTTKTVATTKATSASTATTTKMPQPANGSATPAPNPNLPGVPVSDSNGSGERALVVFGSILAALVVAGVFMAVFMSARRRSPVPAGDPAQYPSFTNPAFGIQMDPLAEEAAANAATLEPAPRPAEKQWPHYMGRV